MTSRTAPSGRTTHPSPRVDPPPTPSARDGDIEVTKFGHACVRVARGAGALVIDPGELTREPHALTGANAVLITHEHPDHVDVARVERALADDPALVVYTCPGVARLFPARPDRVHVVAEHDTVRVAGFTITAVGRLHHHSHPDRPPVDNVGFLVDQRLLHTGDALPHRHAPTVLVAGDAPWLTIPALLASLRATRPERALVVHDGLLSTDGLAVLDAFLAEETRTSGRLVRRLRPGERIILGRPPTTVWPDHPKLGARPQSR